MTRVTLFLFCFLFLMTPVLAGDAGDDFWALVQIRKENWSIDDQTAATSKALREDKINAAEAQVVWEKLHQQASQLKLRSLALESSSRPDVAKAVTRMMRMEMLRLEGLIKAARVETASGRAAARPLWIKQVMTNQDYQQQEALVLDMMNWIEENP